MTATSNREFDIVLFGATGFTGGLVAEYLCSHPDVGDLRWAIAGRNRGKLESLRDELGPAYADLPILVGDCLDRESLAPIAARTSVICTTVGPYCTYGSNLVAACVEAGTDYCDLTGEAHWIRQMIDAHHDQAVEKKVRLVHCCGFDSIPSDLGTLLLQRQAIEEYGAPCKEIRFLVWRARGAVSGGTVATMAISMEQASKDRHLRRLMSDPYALVPDGDGPDGQFQQGPRRDEFAHTWTGPFIMAVINEKVVRRSNALLDYQYGRDFRYSEGFRTGAGVRGAIRAATVSGGSGAFAAAMSLGPTRKLLRRFVLPSPGEGPDEQARSSGSFEVRLFGRGTDADGADFEVSARVGADLDPGYGATAIMLGESALCLAQDTIDQGLTGGDLTPASALGTNLIERLRSRGMTFEIED